MGGTGGKDSAIFKLLYSKFYAEVVLMLVIGKESEDYFCENLAKVLTDLNGDESADFYPIEHRHHPDGETLPRLTDGKKNNDEIERLKKLESESPGEFKKLSPDERSHYIGPSNLKKRVRGGEKALIVMRGYTGPGWQPNDIFLDSLFLAGELRDRCRKGEICVVWPYYPYSRQHGRYREGEPHSAKYVRKVITENGRFADMLITVSAHNHRTTGEMDGNCWNLDATPAVIKYLEKTQFMPDRYLVTCDSGQALGELRFPIAKAINASTVALRKERDRLSGDIKAQTKVMEDIENPEQASLLYYDDELDTGGTLYKNMKQVIEMGFIADNMHAVVVAAKNSYNTKLGKCGCECLKGLGVKLSASDTILSPYTQFSVVPELAEYIHETFW